jgi:signal transduction histidine kinase
MPSASVDWRRQQEDTEVHHRAMEVTSRPPVRVTQRASRSDRDWLLRAHDIKGVVSCLTLIGNELRESRSGRQAILGDRVLRACCRLMQLSGASLNEDRRDPSSLSMLLEEVEIFARILAGPRTRIETETCHLTVQCAAETAIFRILLNLVSNAVRATNESGGGLVRIEIDLAGGDASVLVTNEGTGLISGRTSSGGRRPGSGLGLVIAETLALELGGSLRLRRGRPGTTSLKLILPLSVFTDDV